MLLRSWLKILIFCSNIAQCVKVSYKRLAHQNPSDLHDDDLAEEMQHLPVVHKANFVKPELKPLQLLNLLTEYKLCELFPNVC